MTEDGPAYRTRDEPYRKGCERSQGSSEGIDVGKKQGVKDERRRGAVDEEIVPLDDGSDRTGKDNRGHAAFSHGRRIEKRQLNAHGTPLLPDRCRSKPTTA
jgi:hypothetical protein